jgi:ABC-type transport system substrate-binding protein
VTKTQLDIVWPAGPQEYKTLAEIYQSDLAQIGLDVTLRPMEGAAFLQAVTNIDYQGVRFGVYSLGNLSPASSTLGAVYGPKTNFSGFKDEAYTQLVNQIVTETDPAKQRQLHDQLNDYYLDQSWVLQIVQNPEHAAARTTVRGLRYDARPGLVLAEVSLA